MEENLKDKNILFKSTNGMVEICEMPEDKISGRVKIRMSAHEIYPDRSMANENGISWLEQYTQDNIDTCIGMPFVVSWLDTKEEGIPSDHGRMEYCDDGTIVFEGDVVGSVQDAYIEDIEIDGAVKKVLICEGYIYEQRNKAFVDFLREQQEDGNTVYGSIEINGKDENADIEYLDGKYNEDGSLKMDRVPTKYCYSGLAILFDTPPADESSQVIEVNSKLNNDDENIDASEICVKKDLIGTEEVLKIDKSKDSLSDDSWGDVDKSSLNKKCLLCSNWETVCNDVFMKLEDGWKDGKEGSLKYPVMQLKEDTLVYNKGALASALTYAKKQNETEVINKVEKIRKDMGLDEDTTETNSQSIIINNKKGEQTDNMNLVKKSQVIEINNLEVYDIEKMLLKAFLIAIGCFEHSCDYWVSYLYPLNSEFIVEKFNNGNYQYYKTSYVIDETAKTVTLGDIYEVERNWTPVNNEKPIELNVNKEKECNSSENNKGGDSNMEENKKTIDELNAKITEKDTKIGELNARIAEKDVKITELNESIVNANKSVEELNTKIKNIEEENNKSKTEVNTYKEKLEKLEKEKDVVEANTYFETEIKKNGFEEVEINSLKEIASKGDLKKLKEAEAELCAKKFKEMVSKSINEKVETNSSNGLENMIVIKEEKIKQSSIEEGKSLFM